MTTSIPFDKCLYALSTGSLQALADDLHSVRRALAAATPDYNELQRKEYIAEYSLLTEMIDRVRRTYNFKKDLPTI